MQGPLYPRHVLASRLTNLPQSYPSQAVNYSQRLKRLQIWSTMPIQLQLTLPTPVLRIVPMVRAALVVCTCLMAQAIHAQSGIDISSENGTLSVQANNVSASELASELSNELGINVVVTGDAETRVNLDIVEEPLDKALAKLSPNNMLVRDSNDNDIIEVVLMMGEGQNTGAGGGADQFLPSGSPAEEVIDSESLEQIQESDNPDLLRDPNRSEQVRAAAAAASSDANLPAAQVPPMFADDGTPIDPSQIDPATGLPYNQEQ